MRKYTAEQIGLKYYLSRKQEYEREEQRSKMLAVRIGEIMAKGMFS